MSAASARDACGRPAFRASIAPERSPRNPCGVRCLTKLEELDLRGPPEDVLGAVPIALDLERLHQLGPPGRHSPGPDAKFARRKGHPRYSHVRRGRVLKGKPPLLRERN